ncbi:MFS transporter, partial [Crocinitomix sp.]|nr:MFS transporter [Crocinitomix sp.]
RLVKAYGNRKVIMLGFIGWTTGMFLISFAQSELLLYLALIPYVVGGIAGPTIQGLVSNHVGESEQGNLQGVLVSFGSLAAVIGPSIYTGLFGYYSSESAPIYFPGAPFFLGGMILVIATIIAAWSLKSIPRIQKKVKSDNLTSKEDL